MKTASLLPTHYVYCLCKQHDFYMYTDDWRLFSICTCCPARDIVTPIHPPSFEGKKDLAPVQWSPELGPEFVDCITVPLKTGGSSEAEL